MKQVTMIQVGEGENAKFFLTKEEAQSHELGGIIQGIVDANKTARPDVELSACDLAKAMLLQNDTIVATMLGKKKRKPRTPKADKPATEKKSAKKHVAAQPALV